MSAELLAEDGFLATTKLPVPSLKHFLAGLLKLKQNLLSQQKIACELTLLYPWAITLSSMMCELFP